MYNPLHTGNNTSNQFARTKLKFNNMSGFITRPFYCEHHHKKAKQYVVWGGERQTLIVYSMELYPIEHITPHIVSYKGLVDGKMAIAITCGVIGCGIDYKDPEDVQQGIIFNDIRTFVIPENDWDALVTFKFTGYELSKHKRWQNRDM